MWLVATLRKWDTAFEVNKPAFLPFPFRFMCDSIGFCEVFDDYEKALEAVGGDSGKLWQIAMVAKGG